jgi:hypothetical protein
VAVDERAREFVHAKTEERSSDRWPYSGRMTSRTRVCAPSPLNVDKTLVAADRAAECECENGSWRTGACALVGTQGLEREIRKRDACERSEQVVQDAESEAVIRQ